VIWVHPDERESIATRVAAFLAARAAA
jgi:hypothetical protein